MRITRVWLAIAIVSAAFVSDNRAAASKVHRSVVHDPAGDGFSVKMARYGPRVHATSLDGHGQFESMTLYVAKHEVTVDNADEVDADANELVRSETTRDDEYEFDLSDEELTRATIVIRYSAEAQKGTELIDEYCYPTVLLAKKPADEKAAH